jgi:tRNA threonylcarbamoyladenosine biosynthesis protein TsaB
MKILAFDTSTPVASLALWEADDCLAEVSGTLGRRHSELLFSMLGHALQLASWDKHDIDMIAVGTGPGSFTGLRVGVATAQGLAYALDTPLTGVCSLDALALGATMPASYIASCLDARKGEVYVGLYATDVTKGEPLLAGGLVPIGPPRLLPPAVFAEELKALQAPIAMVGAGRLVYDSLFEEVLGEQLIRPLHKGFDNVRASHLAALAAQQPLDPERTPDRVLPLYIRPSEAEMNIGPPEGGPPLASRLQPDGRILPADSTKEEE